MLDVLYDRNEVCIKRNSDGILVGGYRHDTHPIEGLTEEDLSKYVDEWEVNYSPDAKLITNYKRVTKKGADGEGISGIVVPDENGNEKFYMWDGSYGYRADDGSILTEACLMTHLKHDDEFNDITFAVGMMDHIYTSTPYDKRYYDFDDVLEDAHKFYPEVDYELLKNLVRFAYESGHQVGSDEESEYYMSLYERDDD